jgi:hypothetical protein
MNTLSIRPYRPALAQTGIVLLVLANGLTLRAATYHETILADNPTAYYRLEGLTPETIGLDSSTSGLFTASVISTDGVYPKPGQPGIDTNSISLHPYVDAQGVSQYSDPQVPWVTDLNPSGPFSVEVWARPTSVDTAGNYRCPIGNFGGWGDTSGWHLYQTPDPGSTWVWVIQGSGVWINGGPVTKYKWDHLVAVYTGSNTTFYVNGVARGTTAMATYLPNSGTSFCIGSRDTGYGYFDGNIDEVAMYSTALSAQQVQAHYQVGTNSFRAGANPAIITQDPAPATNYVGRSVSFLVGADGTAPLSYQWYKGTTPIAGATTDTLTFVCSLGDNGAKYKAVVTNLYGLAESVPAALTVLTDVVLNASPAPITRYVGSTAAFRVDAGGALPLSYQWYKDGNVINGATDQTLWLYNVQDAQNNTAYSAKVSNPFTSTNSDPATLSVSPRPLAVPITGYAKVVMADAPVSYWRLDEADGSTTAVDAAGSFDASFDAGAGTFTYRVPTGIPHETDPGVAVTGGARVSVPSALELNPFGPFTVEAWVMPTSLSADGNDYRTAFSSLGSGAAGPIGWSVYQQPSHTWAWVLWGDNWLNNFLVIPETIVASNWYHMVLTYDGSDFKAYLNGTLRLTAQWSAFVPNSTGPVNLGWRSDNDWKPFSGTIDDVALYNKALTADQVSGHYQNTIRLNMVQAGTSVVLSWPFGTLQQSDQVTGQYNDLSSATSPYTNAPSGTQKFYRVRVQ